MNYNKCRLCARRCGADRLDGGFGYCKMPAVPVISRAALHFWEEPIISGERGSGTVFFSGCSLGCVFCQNAEISRNESGIAVSEERLAEIMLELAADGAHNINFVTPTHFAPSIARSVGIARERGMTLPTVYNTGGYDTVEALEMLKGTVDIYLPDFKFYLPRTANEYASSPDYPRVAEAAIAEMVGQRGAPVIENGLMKSGVIVRILLLPSHVAEAKLTVKYLIDTYGDDIYISLMNQYTPMKGMLPPLDRAVCRAEYDELVEYALKKGLKNGFVQEWGTASESFIPPFDNSGVLR